MEGAPQRLVVDGGTVLGFAPHMRFRFDQTRERWVVLAPEKLLMPDETAVEILKLVDGKRPVDAIIDDLTARFAAPRPVIAADVVAMLQDLADKGVVRA